MSRKIIYLIPFVLVLGLVLTNAASAADPNLVGWWKLDDGTGTTAIDSSGNGNDGTLINGPVWATGAFGSALSFDGTNDYVDCGNANFPVFTNKITLTGWVKTSRAGISGNSDPIVQKGDRVGIKFKDNGWLEFYFYADNGTWPTTNISPPTTINNSWHHVAGTFDGTTMKLYLDGTLVASLNNNRTINSLSVNQPVNIGRDAENITRLYQGSIDEVRIYNRTLSLDEIKKLANPEKASIPIPADGSAYDGANVTLKWDAGLYADLHDVYFGDNFNDVNNATTATTSGVYKGRQDPNSYYVSSITRGNTYYWRIDEVNDPNIWRGNVWRFLVKPPKAWSPSPYDGETYVITDPNLSWNAGVNSASSKVYFGTAPGSLVLQTTITHTPGVERYSYAKTDLAEDTQYYWRVDEVNGVTVQTGDVWSFRTTLPGLGTMQREIWENITPTGAAVSLLHNWPSFPDSPTWSDLVAGPNSPQISPDTDQYGGRMHGLLYPPKTGNYTFYIASDDNSELWLSTNDDADNAIVIATVPTWTDPWVWTSWSPQKSSEIYLEYGKKYYISALWKEEAGGDHCEVGWIVPGTTNIELIPGRCVSTYVRYQAYRPRPASNATNTEPTLTLIWTPGIKAVKHDVYFGSSFDDVNSANTSSPITIYRGRQNYDSNEYDITTELNWGKTYYWRVDEFNDPNLWRGNIWSFTVRNYLVVDDFEDYNNTSGSTIIWEKWIKGGGGTVGYPDPNYAEVTIVHGGAQSMPVDYNNTKTPYYSEASRTYDTPQNWAASGSNVLKALSLWFRGYPAAVGSFVTSGGTYTITASGTDIWDVSDLRRPSRYHDEFHFGYKEVTTADEQGYITIIARVESITNTNAWAKAAVMIRDSLDANSTHGIMCISPSSGVAFQYRLETGGASAGSDATTGITAPHWVKLILDASFSNLRAYHSATGNEDDWTQMGETQNIPTMTLPVYVGLAVTSHDASATCEAVFSNVTITAGGTPGTWKHQDIGIKSNVASPLYVTLQDSKTPTPGTKTVTNLDPNIVLQSTWQQWDIPLSDFTGVDLTKIKKIAIGVGSGSADGTGTIYADDVRLYISRCVPDRLRSAADFTGTDCIVDYQDLAILTDNWTISNWLVTPPVGWDPNSDPNLVAYYKFNGNFTDSSDNDNDGNPNDPNVATIVTDPDRGQVASFDGVNDYVNCSNDVSLDITAKVTLSAWVKTLDCGNGQHNPYVAKGDTSYAIKHRTDNSIEFFIYDANGWYAATFTVDSSFNGVWHHVAGTYDGSQVKLYVDGSSAAPTAHSGAIASSTYNLNIGRDSQNTDRLYYGAIDEVRIYSRALSQGEVAYLAGKTVPFNQSLELLLTPQDSAIDLHNDGSIDLRDYAGLADTWLEKLLWP